MRKVLSILWIAIVFLVGCSHANTQLELDHRGYVIEKNLEYTSSQDEDAVVKNIILLIGDGMGANQVEVARQILLQEDEGFDFDKAEYKAEVITSCLDNYVTDSAAAATAFATGVKTNYETVGKDKDGNDLKTILDYAKEAGMKTGIITDKGLNDATPAAFSVHLNNRYLLQDTIPAQQIESGIDIFIGGGAATYIDYEEAIKAEGYDFITTKEGLFSTKADRILATYSSGRLMNHTTDVPTLAEMTNKAINVLAKNKKGFFLMVEAGQIDNRCGEGNIKEMAKSVQELDKALRVALNFARSNQETLVVVLADHETGGLILGDGEPDISWFTEETRYHTPVNVPLYAYGTRSSFFANKIIDNTEVFEILMEFLKLR
ncbi:MAG: alkaline phosphatase [Bacilli bacterium]|jgi:alkaline phosphatase|nr:alkaline phosphatase [Bacilli bacterium]MDY0209669.1 alkaline phosphatase [Bacilli bacterium]